MANPKPIVTPFAETGVKNDIPESGASEPQLATMSSGFPTVTQIPINEGGIPPERADFNGLGHLTTSHLAFLNRGQWYGYDATFAGQIGGYGKNSILMLDNGELVQSTQDGNTNNPNINMTGWVNKKDRRVVLFIEDFGGEDNTDCTLAINKAYIELNSQGGGKLSTNLKNFYINGQCIYFDNIETDFNNSVVTFGPSGRISSALYNSDRTNYIAGNYNDLYYNYQISKDAGNPTSIISLDSLAKQDTITVSSVSGFKAGDYIFIQNGYCDMWRVMEQYTVVNPTKSNLDWNNSSVDLWRCEIAKIKSINGNVITLVNPLLNNYYSTPKTYSFFTDENDLPIYSQWNKPSIERIGGASNCLFKNGVFINNGNEYSISAYCSININAENCTSKGSGKGFEFSTCLESNISKCKTSNLNFGMSIRRGSYSSRILESNGIHGVSDSPIIIWEGSQQCAAITNSATGNGGTLEAQIGVYLNTCWNCSVIGASGSNIKDVVSEQFCRGGNIISNVSGSNVNNLISYFCTFDSVASNGNQTGSVNANSSEFNSQLLSISESHNISLSDMLHNTPYSNTPIGRIHLYKSFNIKANNIDAPNIILWHSTDDDKAYNPSADKINFDRCFIRDLKLIQLYENGISQTRLSYFTNGLIHGSADIQFTHNVCLDGTKILGKDSTRSLILTASHYTKMRYGVLRSSIDFRGFGAVGSENWSSLVDLSGTLINGGESSLLNYVDPSYDAYHNNLSPFGKSILNITVLSNYPRIQILSNPLGDGNVDGWLQVINSCGSSIISVSSVELSSASSNINAVGNKWIGREVFNTTINKFMKSKGSATNSIWSSTDEVTTITPS